MSLTEIESAVESLSKSEQEDLLRHLQLTLERQSSRTTPSRLEWMQRLDALRASLNTGRYHLSSEQIIDELRGE